jgi:peptide/nickel transport system ATP-binding protein
MSQNTGGVTTHAADDRTAGTAVSTADVPSDDAVLSVRALHVEYGADRGGAVGPAVAGGSGAVHAVAGVDLDLLPGHVTALVGESGSGKSSVVAALTGRWAPGARVDAASATFDGQDLFRILRRRHGRESIMGRSIAVVPQDPTVSLDPTMRIGAQLEEAYRIGSSAVGAHVPTSTVGRARSRRATRAGRASFSATEALAAVGVDRPELRVRQYPFQLSGGQRQRVLIAMATVNSPSVVLADEPTSGLDVTVQKTILDQLGTMVRESRMAVLLVTHDLGVAFERADEVLVMQHGQIVEQGPTGRIRDAPQHPYTRALIAAAPSLAFERVADHDSPGTSTAGGQVDLPSAEARLALQGVTRRFTTGTGLASQQVTAVDEVSLHVPAGTTLGIVGGSGSGKTTLARIIAGLETADAGDMLYDGRPLQWQRASRDLRSKVQFVHQNPYSSFDPRYTVGRIVGEGLRNRGHRHSSSRGRADGMPGGGGPRRAPDDRPGTPMQDRTQRVIRALEDVGLDPDLAGRKADRLSGGQRQRVAIARAIILRPELLVLDEPVSALDVTVQDQILRLLRRLQTEHGLTYVFISHDLAVIREISHQVAVMHGGTLVEYARTDTLFAEPHDPYTRQLLAAIPGGGRDASAAYGPQTPSDSHPVRSPVQEHQP